LLIEACLAADSSEVSLSRRRKCGDAPNIDERLEYATVRSIDVLIDPIALSATRLCD